MSELINNIRYRIWDMLTYWLIPIYITIYCPVCGKEHELRVIKLFSSLKKRKLVVWCSNKWRFCTLYKD